MKVCTYVYRSRKEYTYDEFVQIQKEYVAAKIEGLKHTLSQLNDTSKTPEEILQIIQNTLYDYGDKGLVKRITDTGEELDCY